MVSSGATVIWCCASWRLLAIGTGVICVIGDASAPPIKSYRAYPAGQDASARRSQWISGTPEEHPAGPRGCAIALETPRRSARAPLRTGPSARAARRVGAAGRVGAELESRRFQVLTLPTVAWQCRFSLP